MSPLRLPAPWLRPLFTTFFPGMKWKRRRSDRRAKKSALVNRVSPRLEEYERREMPGNAVSALQAALLGNMPFLPPTQERLLTEAFTVDQGRDSQPPPDYNGFMSPAAGHWLDDFFAQVGATAPREARPASDRFPFESSESTQSSTDAGPELLLGSLFQGGFANPFTGDGLDDAESGHGGSATGHSVAASATSSGDSGGGSLSSSSSSSSTAPAIAAPPAFASGIAASSAPAPAPTVVAGSPDPATKSAVTSASVAPATTTSSDSGSTATFSSSSEPATADPIPPPPPLPPPLPIDPLSVLDANTAQTLLAGVTVHGFSTWSMDLRAQVQGGTVQTYSWNLTNAPDATSVTGANTYRLQFTWASFTGAARCLPSRIVCRFSCINW